MGGDARLASIHLQKEFDFIMGNLGPKIHSCIGLNDRSRTNLFG